MPAAGDYVIRVSGHGIIGRSKYSFLEYDFSTSDEGFTALNATTFYDSSGYWSSTDADPGSVDFRPVNVSKMLTGTRRVCGVGIVYDSYSDCGITGVNVKSFNGGVETGGGSVSPAPSNATDRHQTWSWSNRTSGVLADEVRVQINPKTCGANPTVSNLKKVRVWFAENSPTHSTRYPTAPQGLSANGSTDLAWWQEGDEGLVYGDAAYYSEDEWETATLYGGAGGLNIDGMNIPALQALDYSSSHVYEFPYTHGGGSMSFSFTDGYDAEYSRNEAKYLKVEIIPT